MTFANIADGLLIGMLLAGGFGAWRLNQRLNAFKSLLPELRGEISRLDAAIAVAQQALADLRNEAGRVEPRAAAPRNHQDRNPRGAIRNLMASMKHEAA